MAGGQLDNRAKTAAAAGTITVDGMRAGADRKAAAAEAAADQRAETIEQVLIRMRKLAANATVSASPVTAEEREKWAYSFADSLEGKKYDKNISAEVNAEREDPFLLAKANLTSSFTVKAEEIDSLPQEEVLHFATRSHDVNLSVVELLQGHEPSLNAIRIDMIKKEAEHYITIKMEEAFDLADRGEVYQYISVFNGEARSICLNDIAPYVFENSPGGFFYSSSVAKAVEEITRVGRAYADASYTANAV